MIVSPLPATPAPSRRRSHRAALAMLLIGLGCTAIAATMVPSPAAAASFGACAGQPRADVPAERLGRLARGFNLVGWLDRAERRRPPLDLLPGLRQRGFTHIRLPVDGALLMPRHAAPAEINDRLAELDAALAHLVALDFAVSIDMHPSRAFVDRHARAPDQAFEDLAGLWTRLARRYASSPPDRVFFELLNEPAPEPDIWRRQLERLLQTLRPLAPNHTFVVSTSDFQQVHRLLETQPVADRNVVYAVHFYEPMSFTHQGADWTPGDPVAALAGVPFPLAERDPAVVALLAQLRRQGATGAADLLARDARARWAPQRIAAAMAEVAAWSRRHDRAVILNEFGVLKRKASARDRLAWLHAVRETTEARCIGWAVWEFDEAFGFLTHQQGAVQLDEPMLGALLPGGHRP